MVFIIEFKVPAEGRGQITVVAANFRQALDTAERKLGDDAVITRAHEAQVAVR